MRQKMRLSHSITHARWNKGYFQQGLIVQYQNIDAQKFHIMMIERIFFLNFNHFFWKFEIFGEILKNFPPENYALKNNWQKSFMFLRSTHNVYVAFMFLRLRQISFVPVVKLEPFTLKSELQNPCQRKERGY